jgi:hypothetical protein
VSFDEPIDGLLATPPGRLPFLADVQVRAFLLKRARANLIVYNAPGPASVGGEIEGLGGASGQFINHGHEAMFDHVDVKAPIFVHDLDYAEAERSMPIEKALVQRQKIDDDFEVTPIPGHTPGSTAFLWDDLKHRSRGEPPRVSLTSAWSIGVKPGNGSTGSSPGSKREVIGEPAGASAGVAYSSATALTASSRSKKMRMRLILPSTKS